MPFRFPRNDTVRAFCRRHPCYHPDAYYLVQHAVAVCPKYLEHQHAAQHVSGRDLLTVIRKVLLELYGPFAIDVLDNWNVHETEDFGRIVYNLVSMQLLGVSPNDSIHDFDQVFDFTEAFVLPFRSK